MFNVNQSSLNEIEKTINTALAKRGFPKVKAEFKDKGEMRSKIEIESEEFNTTPAIMKSICIQDFGGSVKLVKKENGDRYLEIWIPVYVRYKHFGGGSNGTELFQYSARCLTEQNDDDLNVWKERIVG